VNFFLVYGDTGSLYTLTTGYDGAFHNFKWNISKIKEKWDFKNIFSLNFLSQTVNRVFILNPFSYTIFERNRANNVLFLLNDNILKRLTVNINDTINVEVYIF
jgi:hypothetical protein